MTVEAELTISTRKRVLGGIVAASMLVALVGCGSAPEESSSDGGGSGAVDGFKPCIVSGTGGWEDRSFNELGKKGFDEALKELGIEGTAVASNTSSDFAPNIRSVLDQNCTMVITVGFDLAAAAAEAAGANPDVSFVSIDDIVDLDGDQKTDYPNIKPIIFDTAQAAFLAGYASASFSKTKKVGTFGGKPFPTVTIFMDGFAQGVAYYNSENGTAVQVLGYDPASPDTATFTGGFEANDVAKSTAQNFIDQGADILLPVGGPIYQSAVAAITDSGKDIALIGVDADLFETDPSTQDIIFTSILKGIKSATSAVVADAAAGNFSNEAYVGTLENDGVGYAPFHNFESLVSPDLAGQLETIKAGIIDGSIPVASYLG